MNAHKTKELLDMHLMRPCRLASGRGQEGKRHMYEHGESANGTLGGVMKRLQLVCLLGFLTVACRDIADPTLRRSPLSAVIDAAAGNLDVTLTYNGAAPSASGAVGDFAASLSIDVPGCRGLALGLVTAHAGFSDIVPCAYTLVIAGPLLRPASGTTGLSSSYPLQAAVTITAGATTTQSFELASAMGIVKGTATINGQHPAAGSKVCVNKIGRAHVCTPVTDQTRIPSS